jgi:hypothetical protein
MALTDQQRARLEELRAKDADRDAAAQEAAEVREFEGRELSATLEGAGLVRGVDFEIVTNRICGVYAIRKPDRQAMRNFDAADEKKKESTEWMIGLARHYVMDPAEPSATSLSKKGIEWAQKAAERPGLAWQTMRAFVSLMANEQGDLQRK